MTFQQCWHLLGHCTQPTLLLVGFHTLTFALAGVGTRGDIILGQVETGCGPITEESNAQR